MGANLNSEIFNFAAFPGISPAVVPLSPTFCFLYFMSSFITKCVYTKSMFLCHLWASKSPAIWNILRASWAPVPHRGFTPAPNYYPLNGLLNLLPNCSSHSSIVANTAIYSLQQNHPLAHFHEMINGSTFLPSQQALPSWGRHSGTKSPIDYTVHV